MRALPVALLVAVTIACHGTPDVVAPPKLPPPAPGTCNPSSVASRGPCPERSIPKSNASSRTGCKSDKDCKDGIEGRCIESGEREEDDRSDVPFTRSNGLAEAPMRPPPTICVYDACRADKDCGDHARCMCGEGQERAQCIELDGCLADADCGPNALCNCADLGRANRCGPGNCRSDADCNGAACVGVYSGSFCATPRDRCHARADCKGTSPEGAFMCDWDPTAKALDCRVIPAPPPG